MVRRKFDYPQNGELIIGTVKDINPYSVFVSLDEYPGRVGMIHVSEVARKWIRDVRNFVKKDDKIVCLVLNVDREKDHVTLSLKRLSENEKNKRLQTWKRDEKGEKLLKVLADKKRMTLEKAYEEIGFDIQENFKDMLEVFELAMRKGKEHMEERGIPPSWSSDIKEIAEEKIKIKEIKIEEDVEIRFFSPDGLERIREILMDAGKKNGVSVSYISAPKYRISVSTKDPKEGERILKKSLEEIEMDVKKNDGEFLIQKH